MTRLIIACKIESEMEVIGIVVFALLGMSVASFLNVCIDRLPGGKSLLFPRSHCASCQHRLALKDLIPVFSYLRLRGRCRYCQVALPGRLFWVEIATGILFAFLYWHYGLSLELAVTALYCGLFIVLMVIDLEHGLILNKVVYPSMIAALLISVFLPPSRVAYPSPAVTLLFNTFLPQPGIVQAAIGGGIGLGFLLSVVLISRGGMGWGDVKMAALIGMVTGYLIVVALFLAVMLGGLVAVALLLFKVKRRREGIPFAPFLSSAAIVTLLFGTGILNWYLGLF